MTWLANSAAIREKRDARILELWEAGVSCKDIAAAVDLTPTRVSQIVRRFGESFRWEARHWPRRAS